MERKDASNKHEQNTGAVMCTRVHGKGNNQVPCVVRACHEPRSSTPPWHIESARAFDRPRRVTDDAEPRDSSAAV